MKGILNPKLAESETESFSTSAKKLKDNIDVTVNQNPNIEYRILNFCVVFVAISSLAKCKTCNGNIKFETANARGLGFKVVVKCDSCADNLIPSSPFVAHSYAINRRFIFTMRVLGIGLAGAQQFCGLMGMPRFLTETTYSIILKSIYESEIALAERRAAESTREGRMLRRQHRISVLQAASSAEELLYGPGINDSIVEPGSGMFNRNVSTVSMLDPYMENNNMKDVNAELTEDANTDHRISKSQIQKVEDNDYSMANAIMYHNMFDVTEVESRSNSKPKGDSTITSGSVGESNGRPLHKRRRIRRRKMPNPADTPLCKNIGKSMQPNCNKPNILDSYMLPTSKHIHFDNSDDNKVCEVENEASTTPTESVNARLAISAIPCLKSTSNTSLETLLALRKCSSPRMFVNKQTKHTNDNGSNQRSETEHMREFSNASNNIAPITGGEISYVHLNLEEYPNLHSTTKVNDIIAFKILRIGKEFTPEVSGYIVAKTVGWCPKKMLYSFQILRGQDEIQAPLGKFSLPENEAENKKSDTAQFNFAQLINPRLIHRK